MSVADARPGCRSAGLRWVIGLVLSVVATIAAAAQAPGGRMLEQAELVTFTGTRTVTLPHQLEPDDLPPQARSRGDTVRYRVQLELASLPEADLALYVPKLSLAARLSVNGRPAGSCAVAPLEMARCLHQPHLFVPPRDAWQVGLNTLEFTLFANNRQPSGLARVTVGDAVELERRRAQRAFWQDGLLQALTLALLVLGLIFLVAAQSSLALAQQKLTYRLLGASAIVNALCDLNMLIQVPPVGFELYSWFTFVARLESMPLYFLTLLAFYGVLGRWTLRLTLVAMAAMPVLVWASGNQPWMVRALYLPLGMATTIAFVSTWRVAWRSGRLDHRLMVLVGLVLLTAGWWDFVKVQGGLGLERIYLLPYAYPATLIVMAAMLLDTLRQAMVAQDRLTRTLEEQLAEREDELRQAYADMREAEQRRVREEERSALALHMHDGLGSQLVTARAALAAGEIDAERAARILSECSDDLRLILTTLNQTDASLATCVADFRHRLSRRLAGTGLELEWQVELRDLPATRPAQTLQLLRILQEAVGNAIRHAQASRLSIRLVWSGSVAAAESGTLELSVTDNGKGFQMPLPAHEPGDRPAPGAGLGLFHLRKRAAELGAHLDLVSGSDGTCVRLRWSPGPGR